MAKEKEFLELPILCARLGKAKRIVLYKKKNNIWACSTMLLNLFYSSGKCFLQYSSLFLQYIYNPLLFLTYYDYSWNLNLNCEVIVDAPQLIESSALRNTFYSKTRICIYNLRYNINSIPYFYTPKFNLLQD